MADAAPCTTCAQRAAMSMIGRFAAALSPQPASPNPDPPPDAVFTEIPGDPNGTTELERVPRRSFSW